MAMSIGLASATDFEMIKVAVAEGTIEKTLQTLN